MTLHYHTILVNVKAKLSPTKTQPSSLNQLVKNLTTEEKDVIEANVDDWLPAARFYLARKSEIKAKSRSKFNQNIGKRHGDLKVLWV